MKRERERLMKRVRHGKREGGKVGQRDESEQEKDLKTL